MIATPSIDLEYKKKLSLNNCTYGYLFFHTLEYNEMLHDVANKFFLINHVWLMDELKKSKFALSQ